MIQGLECWQSMLIVKSPLFDFLIARP